VYPLRSYWRRLPTLADRYQPRQNAFGLLRMVLACAVIAAHSRPLGFGQPSIGANLSSGQSDLGTLALYGFFLTSGFLITESGLRSSVARFAWARFLRVFPGLWVCLVVTAFVFAPFAALYEHGTLEGFWSQPDGPWSYLRNNWLGSMNQYPISGLLAGTPYGRLGGGPSAFDGSLWTLRFDLAFYVAVGVLMVTGVLRWTARAVPLLAAGCYLFILRDLFAAPDWTSRPPARGAVGPVPLIGYLAADWALYLGFLFILGAVARLYLHRIPMHGSLAALATALLGVSLWRGAAMAVAPLMCAYLMLYLAVALPKRLGRIGRGRDFTYGIYIYGFPVQQIIALLGGARFGLLGYAVLSVLGSLVFAVPSWYLVEGPAIRLKDRRLPLRLRRRHAATVTASRSPALSSAQASPASPAVGSAVGPRSHGVAWQRAAARRGRVWPRPGAAVTTGRVPIRRYRRHDLPASSSSSSSTPSAS
jgi:peptidoglycan/LPS O-acetylase OafA/YrhL